MQVNKIKKLVILDYEFYREYCFLHFEKYKNSTGML